MVDNDQRRSLTRAKSCPDRRIEAAYDGIVRLPSRVLASTDVLTRKLPEVPSPDVWPVCFRDSGVNRERSTTDRNELFRRLLRLGFVARHRERRPWQPAGERTRRGAPLITEPPPLRWDVGLHLGHRVSDEHHLNHGSMLARQARASLHLAAVGISRRIE